MRTTTATTKIVTLHENEWLKTNLKQMTTIVVFGKLEKIVSIPCRLLLFPSRIQVLRKIRPWNKQIINYMVAQPNTHTDRHYDLGGKKATTKKEREKGIKIQHESTKKTNKKTPNQQVVFFLRSFRMWVCALLYCPRWNFSRNHVYMRHMNQALATSDRPRYSMLSFGLRCFLSFISLRND